MRWQVADPCAARVRRHDPELDARHAADPDRLLRRAHLQALVRRPVGDAAVVRHDARARLELQQLRQQLGVEIRQQIERHHRRAGEVGLEDVAHLEARKIADARLARILGGMLHQVRIQVDAEPARAALRRFDDDPAIARAEVNHIVALLHLGHAHHPLDDLHRRLHIRHRAVVPGPGLRLGHGRCRYEKEKGKKALERLPIEHVDII